MYVLLPACIGPADIYIHRSGIVTITKSMSQIAFVAREWCEHAYSIERESQNAMRGDVMIHKYARQSYSVPVPAGTTIRHYDRQLSEFFSAGPPSKSSIYIEGSKLPFTVEIGDLAQG